MSTGWSWYIIILTLLNIFGMVWLIWWSGKGGSTKVAQGEAMDHVWDGDLRELNNPLPRWWLWLFYITIVFGLLYFAFYPGLGKMKGFFNWTAQNQWEREMAAADAHFGPLFQQYAGQDLAALAKDPKAVEIGQRLFLNYCATCHGSDAGGARGFPSLSDGDWLYGGEPGTVKASILDGRNGMMPPFGQVLGDGGVEEVAAYVASLSGRDVDAAKAEAGKEKFAMYCGGCHMPDGTGNKFLGAPNLTDDVWLYGGSPGTISKTIGQGRNGVMPPHREFLGEDKVHLLAAYVVSLSQPKD